MLLALCLLIALFAIPCFLRWRWLCLYVLLAAAGLGFLWHSHNAQSGEGNGFAEAMADVVLFVLTVSAIAGALARLLMLGLRAGGVRWRYAWLPAPAVLALLIASPWLMHWYYEFEHRPPPDACLAANHRLEIAGAILSVPSAPVFTVFREIDRHEIYGFAWPPARMRAFCKLAAHTRPLPVRLLRLDFVRHRPNDRYYWPAKVCEAVRGRPWLHRFCEPSPPGESEHYPRELEFSSADEMAKGGAYCRLWLLLRRAATADGPEQDERDSVGGHDIDWRLRTEDGTPLAVSCRIYEDAPAGCSGLFEPRRGLAARFGFAAPRDRALAEALAIQARVAEIARDLLRD